MEFNGVHLLFMIQSQSREQACGSIFFLEKSHYMTQKINIRTEPLYVLIG